MQGFLISLSLQRRTIVSRRIKSKRERTSVIRRRNVRERCTLSPTKLDRADVPMKKRRIKTNVVVEEDFSSR